MTESGSVISRIDERLRVLKLSDRAASLKAELSGDAIRSLRRAAAKNPNASPRGSTLRKLAKALETTEQYLLTGIDWARSDAVPAPGVEVPAAMPRDIPVRGSAGGAVVVPTRGGVAFEGFGLDLDKAVDFVRRPPALNGVNDAYAIYVTGESMAPMHAAGELRFVHPHKPARGGDTVLLIVKTARNRAAEAFIKRYIGRKEGFIIVEQLLPAAVMEFKESTVVGVHRVLTLNELFGA